MGPSAGTQLGERLLRNLRDLQLDDELDWPDVQANTFDAKDSVHNQAQRIRKAEWVVYQLLREWDSAATNYLNRLFPAYEPKQSLELRAALFQHLSGLKKDGVLPRDLILRKTMFDDCKGPKFEELLVALSISVLLKVLDKDSKEKSTVKELLLHDFNPDVAELQTLDTAYHAALSHLLNDRANLRRRWQRFGRVLKLKEDEIKQRHAEHQLKLDANQASRIPRRRIERLKAHIERDWVGSSEWRSVLLQSDQHLPQKSLLERPYKEVWQHASDDSLYHLRPEKARSSLHRLEQQVEKQGVRLAKWRKVKASLESTQAAASEIPERPSTARRIESPRRTQSPELGTTAYEQREQAIVEVKSPVTESAPLEQAKRESPKHQESLKMAMEGLEEPSITVAKRPRPESLVIPPAGLTSPARPPVQRKRSQTVIYSPQVSVGSRPSLSRHSSAESVRDDPDESIDFEDDDATNIINSVLNADPSPSKNARAPPLSLSERARLSMAPGSPTKRVDLTATGLARSPSPDKPDSPSPTRSRPISLDERTRRSMSLMANSLAGVPSRSDSRPATARRTTVTKRSSRSPEKRVRLDSPDLSFVDESLLAENVDEDTIFMSRPRIAHSPQLLPILDNADNESVEDFS